MCVFSDGQVHRNTSHYSSQCQLVSLTFKQTSLLYFLQNLVSLKSGKGTSQTNAVKARSVQHDTYGNNRGSKVRPTFIFYHLACNLIGCSSRRNFTIFDQ